MKTNLFKLMFLAFIVSLASCQKEDEIGAPNQTQQLEKTDKISKNTLNQISELHFNTNDVEKIEFTLPDGSKQESYLLEGDILMSESQLQSMKKADVTSKQYRTYNLVSSPKTIRVIGFTANSSQGLTSKQRTALRRAVDNYNALNLGINFTLSFGTNYQSYDMVVYQTANGQAGGVSGFPSNGNPYKFVQIFNGMENYSIGTNEHVITHEMGHSVGLRHTDWFSRQSCGQSGESANPDGAVYIPGTAEGYDPNSVMLACFGANESGNFDNNDKIALEYLY